MCPAAVLAKPEGKEVHGKLPLLAVNRVARGAGVMAGWPLNRALVRCPDLRVLERDAEAEAGLRAELVKLADGLVPDVEITSADAVVLDLATRRRQVDEELLALEIDGAEIWHARAETPDLAYLAARDERLCGLVISPEDLEPLPLDVLGALGGRGGTVELLGGWGLRSLGDFMRLPRQALAERLGPEVGRWHDLLHGRTRRLLRLHRPPESLAGRFVFEDPVSSLEPVVFALRRLLHAVSGRLAARHLAARELELGLELETSDAVRRRLRLAEPQVTVEGMLAPLQVMLEEVKLSAPVVALELDAVASFATAAQREWFGRQLPQPERWAETLAKLEAMLGADRVGIPVPPGTHEPDGFSLHPAAGAGEVACDGSFLPASTLPLRRFRPPREVAVAHEEGGRFPDPLAILTGPYPGRITGKRGPFPVSGNWWAKERAWQQVEWDVRVESGSLVRLAFRVPGTWRVEGDY